MDLPEKKEENTGKNLKISNFDLLSQYLKSCGKLTETLLSKALKNELTIHESEIAKEVSHVANVLCAVYFYRQDKDLSIVLKKMPLSQRKVMEDSLRIIWKHLIKLNEQEVADLAIEAICKSNELSVKIENLAS
ncbi:MAG: hypothetical protein QNJ31_07350 [Candidatus Caenarcaniphilales bacterium]|nr:hypothetical protein [Candidatus Caenarcaniphilales bacterium]